MEEEAKGLSKLVEKQLQEYDREILNSSAILMDPEPLAHSVSLHVHWQQLARVGFMRLCASIALP